MIGLITVILTIVSIYACLYLAHQKGYSSLWAILIGWTWIAPFIYLILPDKSRNKELGNSFENVKSVNKTKASNELMKRCCNCKSLIIITATSCDKCGTSF